MEAANFCLCAANGSKRKTEVCFPLSAKKLTIINNCCFSKHAHLWRKHVASLSMIS